MIDARAAGRAHADERRCVQGFFLLGWEDKGVRRVPDGANGESPAW